eukprot:7382617-Prymnesium_polylepis.1
MEIENILLLLVDFRARLRSLRRRERHSAVLRLNLLLRNQRALCLSLLCRGRERLPHARRLVGEALARD